MEWLNKGINAPKGFLANGIHSGVKRKRKDLSMIMSEKPCQYAGVFTRNVVQAAPVRWNKQRLEQGDAIYGVVINSGNANACTGEQGEKDCLNMAELTASSLNVLQEDAINKENILVASTGVIGLNLNMDKIKPGIKEIATTMSASQEAADAASEGIMTTDTFTKVKSLKIMIDGKEVMLAGMAKGSGMIHPNMGTMLSFVTTDADVDSVLLQKMLKNSVDDTYNMISVDGDTSTNDMVLVMANGASGATVSEENDSYNLFKEAFDALNEELAKLIIRDGEGATKFIEVTVEGMKEVSEAKKMVHAVITSNLVKTAFFGEDANWGRILCALGYSGAMFDPEKVDVKYISDAGEISLLTEGKPVVFDEEYALEILKEKEIKVLVSCHQGEEKATGWGCDFSYDYVKINGEYRT